MTPDQLAAQKLQVAIEAFKMRKRDEVMALKPLPEHDEQRRLLIMQFHIADDVGKTIAAQVR